MAGKNVYFLGSWSIFPQFVLCLNELKKTTFPGEGASQIADFFPAWESVWVTCTCSSKFYPRD